MTAAATAALLVSGVALALISDGPGTFDVVVPNSGQSKTADLGNATVEYIGSSASNQSSGTGIFDPFVRLQGAPTEEGYNTNGPVEFETKSGKWTHAILASAIPVVDCDGDGPGTDDCWELFVDINESNTAKYVSLNEVEIWLTTDANIGDYDTDTDTGFAAPAELIYDFTGSILIHDVNQGSGRGDLRYLVPVQDFDSDDFFVLYSEWGTTAGASPDGKTWGSEGGFEEWKVRKTPNINIVKTADDATVNAGDTIGFDLVVSNTGVATAEDVVVTDQLNANFTWSINPAVAGCSISAGQLLTCNLGDLAPGDSVTIQVEATTDAADCGTVPNQAFVTTSNDGSDDDSASITIQCAAIRILKDSVKGGAVANDGAVFSYGTGLSVTDNGTGDEDADVGEICVSGLEPGTYTVSETTPPDGYAGASGSQDVVAAQGTNCTDNQPTGTGVVTFVNAPLYDIQVNFRDGGSGETSATSITCTGGDIGAGDSTAATGWDQSETFEDEALTTNPEEITCVIVVDP